MKNTRYLYSRIYSSNYIKGYLKTAGGRSNLFSMSAYGAWSDTVSLDIPLGSTILGIVAFGAFFWVTSTHQTYNNLPVSFTAIGYGISGGGVVASFNINDTSGYPHSECFVDITMLYI